MAVYKRNSAGRKCKKGEPGRWYYKFMINGTLYRSAIPEATTKQDAQTAEANARKEVFDGTYGKATGRIDFEKYVREEYLPWARENKRSWKQDEYYAEVLIKYFRGKKLCDITPSLVERFKRDRLEGVTTRNKNRSKSTVKRELGQLSKIFSKAIEDEFLKSNPCRNKWPKGKFRRERFVTREEEARIFEAMSGEYAYLRPVITLALNTGMRRGEMFELEWRDVRFDNGLIKLRPETTKNGRSRTLPMNETVRSMLNELSDDAEQNNKVFSFNRQKAGNDFSALCRSLGLGGITLHTLRHTFNTRLSECVF